MPRQLRIQYAGAIYHLLSRGDRRESIFIDDKDRRQFLATLGRGCLKTGWQVHAYCLMSNHFHLVIETPRPNLVEGMKWLLGTYTMRFNRRHRVSGHLFAGRYKSLLIDGAASDYLRIVCDYVHLNPVRAGPVRKQERLRKYRWRTDPFPLFQLRVFNIIVSSSWHADNRHLLLRRLPDRAYRAATATPPHGVSVYCWLSWVGVPGPEVPATA